MMENDWNDYRMTASSHPKRVLELYRDCFFWRWNDAGMTGWNEKKIRADSDRLHPCHIPSSWRAPGRTRGWRNDSAGFKTNGIPQSLPIPSSSDVRGMTSAGENDQEWREISKQGRCPWFFSSLHPVILVSFHHKNGHPYTIPSFSCHDSMMVSVV